MPLKRGLERSSCDFCFRRKIKCDRVIRVTQGFEKCSPCDVREERCCLDGSSDMRIQRRRIMTPRGGDGAPGGRGSLARLSEAHDDRDSPDGRPGSFAPTPRLADPALVDDGPVASLQRSNEFGFNDEFALSDGNVLFLNHVFIGESLPTEWSDGTSMTNVGDPTWEMERLTDNIEGGQTAVTESPSVNAPVLGDDAQNITTALHAYFDHAASYLPILIAEAFWTDFHAGRCSPSLLYAVACRGMPYVNTADKWDIQEQYARTFRENFLEARAATIDDNVGIGLDDLEALALMVDFQYEDAGSPPLHTNLGRLFLTHESLVLMMLRNRKHEDNRPNANSNSERLSRASERRVLLYWHVYGLDAFHCLDRRQQSLIPDLDVPINHENTHPQHEAKDYFDAILGLAIIARKITQVLCSAAAKRNRVSPKHVRVMYEELAYWRSHGCMPQLRRSSGIGEDLFGSLDNNKTSNNSNNASNLSPAQARHLQLRRAVLCALELNCTMQIEACVSDSRLYGDDSDLDTEQVALQIEFESVRALGEMQQLCKRIRRLEEEAETGGSAAHRPHGLIDLAPNILRNACAGLCYWACQRGMDVCERDISSPYALQAYGRKGSGSKGDRAKTCMTAAQLLRDCATTAVSHKDTVQVLERLDRQLGSLAGHLERP